MGRIGVPELLIVLAIVIVIFGANRLPGLGKGIGSAIRNFKDGMKESGAADKPADAQVTGHTIDVEVQKKTESKA